MKKNIVIIYFLLSLCIIAQAQNLVINPSFEKHSQCSSSTSHSISNSIEWHDANGTCDYYSASGCVGSYSPPIINPGANLTWYQNPLSGVSFGGFIPYYNTSNNTPYLEYLQGSFSSNLDSNKLYYVEFYINSVSQIKYFIHDIDALITDTSGLINPEDLQQYHPQILPKSNKIYKDTTKWMRINGYYTAHGGENYITIGNYTPYGQELKDSVINYSSSLATGAYYFIDSVGVYEVTHLDAWNAGPDKYINYGDSVEIGNPNTDLSMFEWINSINDFTYLNDSTQPNPWSKPSKTTTYYVTKTQGSTVFKDTVTVFVTGGNSIKQFVSVNEQVRVWPNPTSKSLSLSLSKGEGIIWVNVYDVLGKEVSAGSVELVETLAQLDVSSLSNGVYFIEVKTKDGSCTKKIVIHH